MHNKEAYIMNPITEMVKVKNTLMSLSDPKNAILARLKDCLTGNNIDRVVCGYSRMHNRHNRS